MTSVLEDNVDNLRENNTTSGLQSTNGNPYGVSFEEDDEGDKQDEEENEVVDDIDGEIVGEEDENDNTEDNVNKARANIDENPWIKVVEKSLQDVDIEFDSVSKMMLEKVNEQIPLLLEKLHQEMLSEIMTCPSEMERLLSPIAWWKTRLFLSMLPRTGKIFKKLCLTALIGHNACTIVQPLPRTTVST